MSYEIIGLVFLDLLLHSKNYFKAKEFYFKQQINEIVPLYKLWSLNIDKLKCPGHGILIPL